MTYTYILQSHHDIGYSNFFDQFREDYGHILDEPDEYRLQYINDQFKKYNCHAMLWSFDKETGITFESEKHFHAFVLRYG